MGRPICPAEAALNLDPSIIFYPSVIKSTMTLMALHCAFTSYSTVDVSSLLGPISCVLHDLLMSITSIIGRVDGA